MLQRVRISTKLAILVAIPLLSLVLLGLVAAQTFQQVRVGGEAYERIVTRRDVIAEVQPSSLLLDEAYLAVQRLSAAAAGGTGLPSDATVLADRLTDLRARYDERLVSWSARLPADDLIRRALLEGAAAPAGEFWAIAEDEVVPALTGAVAAPDEGAAGLQLAAALRRIDAAYEDHRAAMDGVAALAADDLRSTETAADDLTREQMVFLVGTGLAIVLIVAAAGSLVARSISTPIRTLTEAANEAATKELPELVATVRDLPPGADPPPVEPVAVRGGAELDALAASVDELRRTAVEVAAGEARLRQQVSATFVNLGRRNQNLLNRTLSFISSLEQHERDPAVLDNLFRLDHLVTRMRRNAESLLVLAGNEPARTWSQPVAVGDVVRGALSEIEAYDRVVIGSLEPVEVRGASAADLSHLLAELLENATTFSPPSAAVTVSGAFVPGGYQFAVADRGIGMTAKELREANSRLAEPARFDESPLLVLGHFVVSRLAQRHGIEVRLDAAADEGVTARVTLPPPLLEGMGAEAGGSPAAEGTAALATPLAAEAVAPPAGTVATDSAGGFDGVLVDPAVEPARMVDPPPPPPAALPGSPQAPGVAPAEAAAAPLPDWMTAAERDPADGHAAAFGLQAPAEPAASSGAGSPAASSAAGSPEANGSSPAPGGMNGLLPRRTPGAQMPDTGPEPAVAPEDEPPPDLSPEDVRRSWSNFQGGVLYAHSVAVGDSAPGGESAVGPEVAIQGDVAGEAAIAREAVAGEAAIAGKAAIAGEAVAREAIARDAAVPATDPVATPGPEQADRPAVETGSLLRRVRGAQMPYTGPTEGAAPRPERTPDEVRSTLASYQRAQDQARLEVIPTEGSDGGQPWTQP